MCSAPVYLGYCENMGKFAILLAFPHDTADEGKREGVWSEVMTCDLYTHPRWGIKCEDAPMFG